MSTKIKDQSIKISVIIPVFNSEKYLKECLNSVIEQTLKDIEIICVDDGSTDNSLSILEEYKKKDKRLTILKQQHKGAGAARNLGLDRTNGQYILFCDADDFISNETALESIYISAVKANTDIVLFNYCAFNKKEKIYKRCQYLDTIYNKFGNTVFSLENSLNEILYVHGTVCGKLYKKELISINKINFYEDIIIGEDLFFYIECALNAKRFIVLNNVYYYYRKGNIHSLSNTTTHSINQQILGLKKLIKNLKQIADNPTVLQHIVNVTIRLIGFNYNKMKNFYDKMLFRKHLKKELNFTSLNINNLEEYKKLKYKKIKISIKIPMF